MYSSNSNTEFSRFPNSKEVNSEIGVSSEPLGFGRPAIGSVASSRSKPRLAKLRKPKGRMEAGGKNDSGFNPFRPGSNDSLPEMGSSVLGKLNFGHVGSSENLVLGGTKNTNVENSSGFVANKTLDDMGKFKIGSDQEVVNTSVSKSNGNDRESFSHVGSSGKEIPVFGDACNGSGIDESVVRKLPEEIGKLNIEGSTNSGSSKNVRDVSSNLSAPNKTSFIFGSSDDAAKSFGISVASELPNELNKLNIGTGSSSLGKSSAATVLPEKMMNFNMKDPVNTYGGERKDDNFNANDQSLCTRTLTAVGFGRGYELEFMHPYVDSGDEQSRHTVRDVGAGQPSVRSHPPAEPTPQRASFAEKGNHPDSSSTFQNIGGDIHTGPSFKPRTTHSIREFVPTSVDPIIHELFKDDFSELEATRDPLEKVQEMQAALRQTVSEQQKHPTEQQGQAQQECLAAIDEGDVPKGDDRSQAESSAPQEGAGQMVVHGENEPIDIEDSAEHSPSRGSSPEYSDSQCQEQVPPAIPVSAVQFLSFRVAKENLPALEAVQRTHPETFTNFQARSPLGGGMLLDNLAMIITSLQAIPLKQFAEVSLQDGKGALIDLQDLGGLEVGWLISHMEHMYQLRRAFKVRLRVETKRREVEKAQARVDLARTALAQREIDLRDRQAELKAVLREKEELEAASGTTYSENDPVSKGLFPPLDQ